MRVSSPLLYNLSNGTDSQPGPEEQRLFIPPSIQPIASLPLQVQEPGGFGVTVIQRGTFIAGVAGLTRAASQPAASTTIATLGKGLWRVRIDYSVVGSATEVFTDGNTTDAVFLTDPENLSLQLLVGIRIANTLDQHVWNGDVLLVRDGWSFTLNIRGTGAGETARAVATLHASRLI